METPLVNAANEEVGRVDLPEEIFGAPVNEALLWEVVRMQLANRRRGTHATKTRSEVAGSGRKLWVQKGTGRARVGDRRNPLWKGGGTVHGPQPRSYAYSMPKKKRRLALRSALAAKARDGELLVVESLGLEAISTKQLAGRLKALGAESALIVVAERDEVVEKSARNLPGVKVLRPEGLNVYDILRYEKLVLLQGALDRIQERV
ncbi:MAG: 50S ribosomal protein L4 [Candidatus Dadabacteria bacterium]|nr:MAG: 50S ribosomal protein L4 [Candidatus Dadabacteria bacterium]